MKVVSLYFIAQVTRGTSLAIHFSSVTTAFHTLLANGVFPDQWGLMKESEPTLISLKVDLALGGVFGVSWSYFWCFGRFCYYSLNLFEKLVIFHYSKIKIMENGRDVAISVV